MEFISTTPSGNTDYVTLNNGQSRYLVNKDRKVAIRVESVEALHEETLGGQARTQLWFGKAYVEFEDNLTDILNLMGLNDS